MICSSGNVPKVKSLIMSSRVPSRDLSSTSFDLEKKRYCLWTLICILAMIGFCNLILSITIIAVLRVSQGMESLEVIPNENLVKFYGSTDLDKVNYNIKYKQMKNNYLFCIIEDY